MHCYILFFQSLDSTLFYFCQQPSHTQGDRASAALASALDATAWDDRMIAAAYKAVVDDNEEALRRIVATCADAPVSEPAAKGIAPRLDVGNEIE